jgi:PAS domain S-box-containing protein
MLKHQNKTNRELVKELEELQQAHEVLKISDEEVVRQRDSLDVSIREYQRKSQLLILNGSVRDSGDLLGQNKPERALEGIVDRFETLLAKVPVGLYILGLRSNGRVGFDYVSDRWCEIHQFTREEAMADVSLVNNAIYSEDRAAFQLANTEAIRTRQSFVWEGRIQRGNDLRWIRLESVPISFAPGNHQWYGVTQDITARKLAENSLRENESKLRDLNAQKDQFFSIIAHDLVNPFNGILGFSGLLKEEISEGDYTNCFEYAEIIEQSSKQSVDLLRNLLDWARAHTGRIQFQPIRFDLGDLISANKLFFDTVAGQKTIRIINECASEVEVFADKQMLQTILRNLISNAIKFTQAGGEIVISVSRIAEDLIISVRDNGIGIAKERLEKLFQIEESKSTLGTVGESGTGLGLMLCREFVEKHGGKLWVDSELGQGSTFSFSLVDQSRLKSSRVTRG